MQIFQGFLIKENRQRIIGWISASVHLPAISLCRRSRKEKLTKVLENPQVIKTPVVRNGKQSTLGYQPDVWKSWK